MLITGWQFTPEGAAVHEAGALGVIADLHLGYDWTRGRAGDVVIEHTWRETRGKLESLLARHALRRLIVAGDLVESSAPCAATRRDLRAFERRLAERGIELITLRGNHDPRAGPEFFEHEGWTIAHGDRPLKSGRIVVGHHHPVVRAGGHVMPAFLVGDETIALPAFSMNAAGWDVATRGVPPALNGRALNVVVVLDQECLDFGPAAGLPERLRRPVGRVSWKRRQGRLASNRRISG